MNYITKLYSAIRIFGHEIPLYGVVILSIAVLGCVLIHKYQDDIRNSDRALRKFKTTFTVIGILYLLIIPRKLVLQFISGEDASNLINELPLHICSLTTFAYVLSFNSKRFINVCKYTMYPGFIGGILALMFPSVSFNLTNPIFYHYMIGHTTICLAYYYYLVVLNRYPNYRDNIVGIILFYVVEVFVLLPFNMIFDTYYGFIGPTAYEVEPVVRVFGDFPWVILGFAIGVVIAGGISLMVTHLFIKFKVFKFDSND